MLKLFDMRWLSRPEIYYIDIPEENALKIYAGEQTVHQLVDLPKLVQMDRDPKDPRQFVVGGRVYFELTLGGSSSSSYITKGFLDQLGYVEPAADSSVDQTELALSIVIPLGIVLLIVGFCIF